MTSTLLLMFSLIGLGFLWVRFNPSGIAPEVIRKVLVDLVYVLFLPALVLRVIWQAELGLQSLQIAATAAVAVLGSLAFTWLLCKLCRVDSKVRGAIILAASFPNATYLGYPLLTQTLGDWAGSVAIQYDLFACTPILLTLGVMIAARMGGGQEKLHPVMQLLKVPPLWAALAGILLNISATPMPVAVADFLQLTGAVVIPIMLFVIGLALAGGVKEWRYFSLLGVVVLVQMFVMPLFVLGMITLQQIPSALATALLLEGAMPSMALGIALCDRYGLNSGVYAAAVTLTTLLSLLTLPLWYSFL